MSLRLGSGAERPQPLVLAFPFLALTPADASSAGLYGNDKYRYAQRSKYEKWCSHGVTAGRLLGLGPEALSLFLRPLYLSRNQCLNIGQKLSC